MKSFFTIAFALLMASAVPSQAQQPTATTKPPAIGPADGQTAGKRWSLSRSGGNMRFEVRPLENATAIGDIKGIERSEVVLGKAIFDKPMSASWTFTWDSQKGPVAPDLPYAFLIAGQWHATEDRQDIHASPPVAFDMYGGVMKVCIRFSMNAILKKNPSSDCLTRIKIKTGHAYHVRQRVVFARNVRDSSLQVWLDDAPIVDYHGPLGYKDDRPPYLKIGVYRSHTDDIDVLTYDSIIFGAKTL